jgi:dTDP-glucose 4,6-dehydratase
MSSDGDTYVPTKVLITGGAGFICSHVCNFLVNKYPDVLFVCIDCLDYCANMKNLSQTQGKSNFKFIKGSILNIEFVTYIMETFAIDTIMHFAAQSHVDRSFGNSIEFTQTNVLGTHVLLECARQFKIRRFIHVSTDEVYGEVKVGQASETAILAPTNPYACSKAAAEFMCQAYIRSFQLPIIITRGNNVFGPHQFPEKVIPKFIYRLRKDLKCCLHGDGSSRRNFLHTTDVVNAFDIILTKGRIHEIYNIGTTFEITVREMCEKLIRIIKGPDAKVEDWIETADDRAFNDCRYMIDSSKLHSLNWEPRTDFDTLLAETVQWYDEHPGYWPDSVVETYLGPHPLAYRAKTADVPHSASKDPFFK